MTGRVPHNVQVVSVKRSAEPVGSQRLEFDLLVRGDGQVMNLEMEPTGRRELVNCQFIVLPCADAEGSERSVLNMADKMVEQAAQLREMVASGEIRRFHAEATAGEDEA